MTRRRLELNLSIKRAAGITHMSKDTWIRVEKGQVVQLSTYDRVEETLGWTVGSCRKIFDGGEPIALDSDLDGATEIASVPPGELEAGIRQVVQDAMVTGTELNASKIRAVNERVIDMLRDRGYLPPVGD